MSDDDFMVDDDEDYDLEYDEDSTSEPDVDLENQYYNSKALKDTPELALDSFERVIALENGEKGEWGFRALKQIIKLNFRLVSSGHAFFFVFWLFPATLLNSNDTMKWSSATRIC